MPTDRPTRRKVLISAGALASSIGLGSIPTGATKRRETGIVESLRSFDSPVTYDHIQENREKALQKFVELGGERPDGYGFGRPAKDAEDVIAHVVMYDANKGFREFFGRGASPKDDREIRQAASQFRREIAGTQTLDPSKSVSTSVTSSGDEEWRTLSDSRWYYYKDPCGKVEVPYKWRKISNDGSSSYDIFGLRTDLRIIPGYIAYDSYYRNHYHEFGHNEEDDGFQYVEEYSPEGMTFGSSTVTANLGWGTAYWSWSYTTPDVSVEQNGDPSVGDLAWDVPNNDGDKISGNARNSTLTWEPGTRWKFDQQVCKGEVTYLSDRAYCWFNEDGPWAYSDCEFTKFNYYDYNTGDPSLCG